MSIVALDTNALMMPVEMDIRVFDELDRLLGSAELVVPRAVVVELESICESGSGTAARAARVGLDLFAERCREVKTEASTGDASLVELADREMVDYVVTNDQRLRDQILSVGVSVIEVRGHHTLTITEP